MKLRLLSGSLVSALALGGITACSDDGTTTTTTATTSESTVAGQIAGFGSIILKSGSEYNTDNVTTCEVDDTEVGGVCEDSLSVGMYITMRLDSSGAVSSVHYDDDIEGIASNVTGTDGNFSFNVLDVVTVTTTSPATQWRGFDTDPPSATELDGANVEVSGEWLGTELVASYVEKESDTNAEVEGSVGTVNGTAFPLTLENGGTVNVDASGANLVPQAGDYVEVEGSYDTNTDILMATRIELEDEDEFDEDGDAEITGTLLQDSGSTTGFSINSTQVDISNAPSCTNLVGSLVEAEGVYNQTTGVLVVEECEDEEDELEMKCDVSNVTVPNPALSPKVGTIECSFPSTTGSNVTVEFRDSPELAEFSGDDSIDHFDLTDIAAGDCVEIEASMDATNVLVAGLVELDDEGTSGCDTYELAGPVDDIAADAITVLGVTYAVTTGVTVLPDGTPVADDSVKIEDENADGVADSIEIEDAEGIDESDNDNDS
jgi:hypothetical protein